MSRCVVVIDAFLGAASFLLFIFGFLIFVSCYEIWAHPLISGVYLAAIRSLFTLGSVLAALNYWYIWRLR